MNESLAAAVEAVRLAAVVTRQVQSRPGGSMRQDKADGSPVTVADFAAQAVIAMSLQCSLGPVALLGEEHVDALRGRDNTALRQDVIGAVQCVLPEVTEDDVLEAIEASSHEGTASQYWTVDPIDGTRGYVEQAQYCIALARIDEGRPTVGVLGCPNMGHTAPPDVIDPAGSLLAATDRGGAWLLEWGAGNHSATRGRCRVEASDPAELLGSVDRNGTTDRLVHQALEHFDGAFQLRQLDSQCKYAAIAIGLADGYLRIPRRATFAEKIWDLAAGDLIAREAGATMTDLHGRPLDFSHGESLSANFGVICAPPSTHARLIEAVRTCPATSGTNRSIRR